MTRVRGVLFDLDGVVRLWRDTGSRTAETTYGLPEGTIARLAYDGQFDLAHHGLLTHEEWVAGVGERLVAEFGPAAAAAIEPWAADRGDIDHEVVELARQLRAAGLRVAALTNNTTILGQDLIVHDLTDVFDTVINSADIGVCKPAPAAYRIAAARLNLPLAAIGFTDDDPTNVAAAAALGMPAHRYTDPASLRAWLTLHGVTLTHHTSPTPPAGQVSGSPQGCIVDEALAVLGPAAAPPAAAAESDRHSPTHRIRYVATMLTPQEIADYLGELPEVLVAVPDGSSVGIILTDGTACEIRALPPTADPRLAAGDPAAWIPAATSVSADVEYLPAWTTISRAHARTQLDRLAARASWQLTQLAHAHKRGDRVAAAAALDRARAELTAGAAMLSRHHPTATVGPLVGRYLRGGSTARFITSWLADPTSPSGLASATAALVAELRHHRYLARHVLGADLTWAWDHLARQLRPVLGADLDLSPRPPRDNALYTNPLASTYDRHRPVPPAMATGLADLTRTWLTDRVVLELGAGTGRVSAHLAATARTYLAVEYAPAMAHRLAARSLPRVTVRLGDAHHLDLDGNTIDVVVEHEALPFTDDPARALEEIQRVLRPGGLLLRILLHPVDADPAARIDAAYQQAAFADGPGPLIIGKGTDPRLTAILADQGFTTHQHVLAVWRHTRPTDRILAALAAKAWPYQHQISATQHTAGMAAARRAAAELAGVLSGTYRLYALVTEFGAPP